MSDYVDRLAERLGDAIEGTMAAAEADPQHAGLWGALLKLSSELLVEHHAYQQARYEQDERKASRHAHAISDLELQYKKLLRPPGALDIDLRIGSR